jgi:hypothetical protein
MALSPQTTRIIAFAQRKAKDADFLAATAHRRSATGTQTQVKGRNAQFRRHMDHDADTGHRLEGE